MIKLVPITDVKASEYNPRKNDEKRLALTEMSLRKLGFLLPIYADTSGEILSGHQRHLVATRIGFTRIPVQYVNNMDLNERKTVNILFRELPRIEVQGYGRRKQFRIYRNRKWCFIFSTGNRQFRQEQLLEKVRWYICRIMEKTVQNLDA